MGKFYDDTHDAAKLAAETVKNDRETRANKKELFDALKGCITAIAAEGAFTCILIGADVLNGTTKAEREKRTFNSPEWTENVDGINVGSDVRDVVAKKVQGLGFQVENHPSGHIRISWKKKADPVQPPIPENPPTPDTPPVVTP